MHTDPPAVDSQEGLRIGILGGSFNPVHQGHIALLRFGMERLRLQKGILVPTNDDYCKPGSCNAPAAQRLAMCEIAAQACPGVTVSDAQTHRNGPVYTVDTVRMLAKVHPRAKLFLLMGDDVAAHAVRWIGFDDLRRYTAFAVAKRTGQRDTLLKQLLHSGADCAILEGWKPMAISSTQIRIALSAGEAPITGLDPDVLRFIKREGLYTHSNHS